MSTKNIVFLIGALTEEYGLSIIQQLDKISKENDDDIFLYINSPGGSLIYCFSIIETMKRIPNDVFTIVYGEASSAAATIAASGTKGKRLVSRNSEVMFHMPRGVFALNKASGVFATAAKSQQINLISRATGRSFEEVDEATKLELFLSAEQVVEFGSADHII